MTKLLLADDPGIGPARLPPLGTLDRLPRSQRYTIVGYGMAATYGGGQPPTYPATGERDGASEALNALSVSWLHLSQNPTLGNGGACEGDSGGPNYSGDSHVIAGTTITGDYICRSTNVVMRLDIVTARSFLATRLGYPLP